MNTSKRDRNQRILITILGLAVISLIVVSYLNHRESYESQTIYEKEKELLQEELLRMVQNYDSVKSENEGYKKEVTKKRIRIVRLLDSLQESESNYALLLESRRKLRELRAENKRLMKLADSLSTVNQGLTLRIMEQGGGGKTEVINPVVSLNKGFLKVEDLEARTTRMRNGKEFKTDVSSKISHIKISYNVIPSVSSVKKGNAIITQILDPENHVIGDRKALINGDERIFYSKISEFPSFTEPTTISVSFSVRDLNPGIHWVNIFYDFKLVASTSFELK